MRRSRPLKRAPQSVVFTLLFDQGPGSSGGPGEATPEPSVGIPGASGGLPEASGTQDKPKQKSRNLKELIQQWRFSSGCSKGQK